MKHKFVLNVNCGITQELNYVQQALSRSFVDCTRSGKAQKGLLVQHHRVIPSMATKIAICSRITIYDHQ